jgi:hypothetical protein
VTILVLLAIGVGYVAWRVPTRERVLADRARATPGRDRHSLTVTQPGPRS